MALNITCNAGRNQMGDALAGATRPRTWVALSGMAGRLSSLSSACAGRPGATSVGWAPRGRAATQMMASWMMDSHSRQRVSEVAWSSPMTRNSWAEGCSAFSSRSVSIV